MLSRLSLKYRIALVIFVLEGIMMTVVLWKTLGQSLESAAEQQALTHDMLIELVGDLSRTALLTTEYADLQLHLQQVQLEPTVQRVMFANANNRVVARTPKDRFAEGSSDQEIVASIALEIRFGAFRGAATTVTTTTAKTDAAQPDGQTAQKQQNKFHTH